VAAAAAGKSASASKPEAAFAAFAVGCFCGVVRFLIASPTFALANNAFTLRLRLIGGLGGRRTDSTMSNRSLDDFTNAILRNNLRLVKSLLSSRQVDANERSPHFGDASALVFAAHLGRTEIAEVLLNAGARIDDVGV
jgi:hypothetical protein